MTVEIIHENWRKSLRGLENLLRGFESASSTDVLSDQPGKLIKQNERKIYIAARLCNAKEEHFLPLGDVFRVNSSRQVKLCRN